MLHQHISHNPDFIKLQAEGFDMEVRGGYLLVHHVPFLTKDGTLDYGSLRIDLNISGTQLLPPSNHTAYWCGDQPCLESGAFVPSLVNSAKRIDLGNGLITSYFLSLYPDNGMYDSYFNKVSTYYNTIAGPALHKFPDALKEFHSKLVFPEEESSLRYIDTNSSKSNLNSLNMIFKTQKVAIVGLGGTGSYLLDYLAKLDLLEIALYDGDEFNSHNAFRAPGAPTLETLGARLNKCDYFESIYSNMNKSIRCHNEMISENNIDELYRFDMVFLCIDSNMTRNFITRHLAEKNVPFIDTGLGLFNSGNAVGGNVRVTCAFEGNYDHLKDSFGESELDEENLYQTNIQIAEMNALAASIAVIKWKQMLGFFHWYDKSLNKIFNISRIWCD